MSAACQHGAMFAEPDAAIPQHWQVTDIATVLIRRGECIDIDTVPDVGYECSTPAQHQPSMKSGSDIVFWEGGFSKRGRGNRQHCYVVDNSFAAAPGEECAPASRAKLGETWRR